MRTVKALLSGGLATVSLIVAVAVPATAADTKGTLMIVPGVAGRPALGRYDAPRWR